VIRVPARMRAELLLTTAIYGALWLVDVAATIRRHRRPEATPEPTTPEESPREDRS
jgi:hypothetical protein